MKRRNLAAIAGIAVVALAAACNSWAGTQDREGVVQGTGEGNSRAYQVGEFDRVSLAGSHNVVVTRGDAVSVRAEGDPEALERLEIRLEGSRLEIGTRRGMESWFSGNNRGVTVHITAPRLRAASIAGSGNVTADSIEGDEFSGSIAGSGNLVIARMAVRDSEFEIAGSGNVRAAGSGERVDVEIAGSGNVDLSALTVRRADVSVAGSGDTSIHASEGADISIVGSGDVVVAGGARCNVDRIGSGGVRCG